jgi:hypothetical protein
MHALQRFLTEMIASGDPEYTVTRVRKVSPMSSPDVLSPQSGVGTDTTHYSASEVAAIAERLERNQYDTLFGCLDDWHALKAISYQQPDLVQPYVHLLELEVDED